MAELNLLPTDIAPKGPVNKIANILKKVAIGGVIMFILFLAFVVGYFLFIQSQIRSSEANQVALEESIRSLEQTEQRLVLLKDRIKRANTVLSEETATPSVDSFEQLFFSIPVGVRLTEADITAEVSEVSFVVSDSSQLAQLMAGVFSLEEYERIELTTFGFSPTSGYLISLEMR